MKTIKANFRRITGYGVAVFLAAASCFSAFADCTVTWDEEAYGWHITCDFADSTFIPAEGGGGGGGGGGGSCTNCTAMSPSECEFLKSQISQEADSLGVSSGNAMARATFIRSDIYDAQDLIQGLKEEGDSFTSIDPLGTYATMSQSSWNTFVSHAPQSEYIQGGSRPAALVESYARAMSADSIYNYYNDGVKPVLDQIEYYLNSCENSVNELESEAFGLQTYVDNIKGLAENMNCTACQSSGDGGGSSGGGGDSGGGTTPSGCPCSEFINAVKTAVDNCKTKLDDIDTKLSSIKSRLDSWDEFIKQIKDDVYKIRQTTDRMDDFFKDDTEYNFKKLIEHTLTLSNAVFSATLKLPPNLYWTEYTNATQFLDDSGSSIDWLQKGKTIEAGAAGAVIDFGEYGQLNWFQRMEFLLGHIAGIFSPTNSTNADFSSEEKEKTEDAQDVFDGLTFDDEKSILNQMVSYVEEAESSLNPFHGIFDYSSGSTRSITFLPDVSVENDLLGNTMPTITMDLTETGDGSFSISDLVDLAHNLTTFLWYVSFLIIDVLAIIKFVQCLIALNRWYWKIYNSWVSTMFSGGGR